MHKHNPQTHSSQQNKKAMMIRAAYFKVSTSVWSQTERETERERKRERQTDRQRDRERQRDRDRERQRDREVLKSGQISDECDITAFVTNVEAVTNLLLDKSNDCSFNILWGWTYYAVIYISP